MASYKYSDEQNVLQQRAVTFMSTEPLLQCSPGKATWSEKELIVDVKNNSSFLS